MHLFQFRRRFTDDHLALPHASIIFRQRAAHFFHVGRAIHDFEHALAAVIIGKRLRLPLVSRQPLASPLPADRRRAEPACRHRNRRSPVTFGGARKCCTSRRPRCTSSGPTARRSRTVRIHSENQPPPACPNPRRFRISVQLFGLRQASAETHRRRSRASQSGRDKPLLDHLQNEIVRNQLAALHDRLGQASQFRVRALSHRAACRRSRDAALRNAARRASPACPSPLPAAQEKSARDSETSAHRRTDRH